MQADAQEFYQLVIADLKEQLSHLSDQKATQAAFNKIAERTIGKLQEEVNKLDLENKELKEKLDKATFKK
jgi:hypothetical protein